MTKEFNNRFFKIKFMAYRELYYGWCINPYLYLHTRGVFCIKIFGKEVCIPKCFTSFRIDLTWLRWTVGIDFVKWKR